MLRRRAWCWHKRGVRGEGHEAELSLAPHLLKVVPLQGRVVTGDALYCQRRVCQQVVEEGGDYLVAVKENQRGLHEDIALVFSQPPPGENFPWVEQEGRHGDRREVRRLWATTALQGYLDWPGAQQVCKVVRRVVSKGEVSQKVGYAITSLGPPQASAQRLLEVWRGHWGIENRLHYVRDETLGEDRCRVRSGNAPHLLAALRNVVLGLLRLQGTANIAAALRHYSWHPREALALIGLQPP